MTKRIKVKSWEDLKGLAVLEDILYTNVSAKRLRAHSDDDDVAPAITFQPEISDDGAKLRITVSSEVRGRGAEITVELEVRYLFDKPVSIPEDVVIDFMGNSTVVSVAPHIRELFQSMASRLRVPIPLMGLVGPMALKAADDSEEVDSPKGSQVNALDAAPI